MTGTDNKPDAANDVSSGEARKRHRSEVEFPYSDLQAAVELAQTIHDKAGTSCETDELAAWMGQTASGGTFRTRLGAARTFGLVETAQGRVTLTQLGRDALDSSGKERGARVTAFLNAELFGIMYDQYKGNALPPPPAIERQMLQLGVSPKQTERARQTFIKSAQYAGFVDPTSGRFVKPGIQSGSGNEHEQRHKNDSRKHGGGGGDDGGDDGLKLDPLLMALLKKIPAPQEGWPEAKRVRWFRTFAMNVSQIYDGDDEPVEMKIEGGKTET